MYTRAFFENISTHISKEIDNAHHSIYVAVAWFTDVDLMQTLGRGAEKGIDTQLIICDDEINDLDYYYLSRRGVKVWKVKKNNLSDSIMHNKFCIIDKEVTITGSYNWTNQARHNQESITITRYDKSLAKQFLDRFSELKRVYFLNDNNVLDIIQDLSERYPDQRTNLYYNDPRDFKGYSVVKIGTQFWMAENLKYIPGIKGVPPENHASLFLNDENVGIRIHPGYGGEVYIHQLFYEQYGCFYNWETALNVPPLGWRLPSKEDFEELFEFIIGYKTEYTYMHYHKIAMQLRKESDEWNNSVSVPSNNTKFSAIPGGYFDPKKIRFYRDRNDRVIANDRKLGPHFDGLIYGGFWWTSSQPYRKSPIAMCISNDSDYKNNCDFRQVQKRCHLSVRCIKK